MNRKKVLIVDDEPHIIELIRVCLEESDYEILEAFDGQEALEKVKDNRPDLILLDIMIPKIDGFEVCRILKEDPATNSIPIVIVTAKGQEVDRIRAFRSGVDSYITKPFSPVRLLTEVKERLGET